jgi:beta-xylosidase
VHSETPTDAVHPSCVRVGDWYYAVTSTFEYLPALPIYRSRDLASWAFKVGPGFKRSGGS